MENRLLKGDLRSDPTDEHPGKGAEGFELQDLADDFRPYGVAP